MAQKHNSSGPPRPTITLPPRPSMDALFTGGFSPGPMTLVSSFFSTDNYPDTSTPIGGSFSQLLAGAMASPLARPSIFLENSISNSCSSVGASKEDESNSNLGFKQSRPMSLMVARSPLFTVPPGLSPSGLLNSPGFFSPQCPYGMSHQQALAQVTAQAALVNQSHMHMQSQYQQSYAAAAAELMPSHPSSSAGEASQQHLHLPPSTLLHQTSTVEPSESSQSDKKYQPLPAVDKPNDDGYNWRKYGQKPIKGSEYPRSYYKCTHLNCPVKKKVERSSEGQITEIIYKGQHNHEMPQSNKRARDNNDQNGTTNSHAKSEVTSVLPSGNTVQLNEMVPIHGKGQESNQSDPIDVPGTSDSEEGGDPAMRENGVGDEPDPKRRQTESVASEPTLTHKTVTEPKIIVQTRSEVDLLDDGYRWRKYGQKVVKGNPHPRSYYKCTSAGCNVRKHVERAATDPKAVITTYEGKHNHDVPAARNSSHNPSISNVQQPKPQNVVPEKHSLLKGMDFGNNDQRPVLLRLKEEEIAV